MDVRDRWIESHPFLAPVARLLREVEAAAAAVPVPAVAEPRWSDWEPDRALGVPLLRIAARPFDAVTPAAEALGAVVDRLAERPLPPELAAKLHELRALLRRSCAERERVVAWAIAGAPRDGGPPQAGLAAFLAWTALRRVIAPVAERAAGSGDAAWTRRYCPVCGALPILAHLVAEGDVRRRDLVCGCCSARWPWKRIACAFCENEDPSRLDVLELADEPGLRIDVCQECHGYLKTYDGRGDERLMLADWSTLHLDAIARERGLARRGASLFEL